WRGRENVLETRESRFNGWTTDEWRKVSNESFCSKLPSRRGHGRGGDDFGGCGWHYPRSFHVFGPCTSQPARLGVAISVRHLLSSASGSRPRPLGFLASLDLDRGNNLSYGRRRLGAFRIHNRKTNCRARFASYSRRHASICMDRL